MWPQGRGGGDVDTDQGRPSGLGVWSLLDCGLLGPRAERGHVSGIQESQVVVASWCGSHRKPV